MMIQNPETYLNDIFHHIIPFIISNALNVVAAIVILLIGNWAAGRADLLIVKLLDKTPHFDEMLKRFFAHIVRYLILTVTILAILSQFGIQTTSLVAVLGAAGLAIGLALQGTLSNLAAGVMLLIFRPFKIGHRVQISGIIGTVKELSLFWTELVTDDSVQVIVPNHAVWGQPLRNFTIYPTVATAAELRFRIPGPIDLDFGLAKVKAIVCTQPGVLKDPEPTVLLDYSAAENAVEIVVGFSTADGELPIVRSELIKAVYRELEIGLVKEAAC